MSHPTKAIAERSRVDETRYGPGPWVGEPDRLEWRYRGFPCLMVRNVSMGNWCGYVGLPRGHAWYGARDADVDVSVDVSVHGGVTYASACSGDICHVPRPGESDDVWWLGFDCAHAGDLIPSMHLLLSVGFGPHVYRDVAYVRAECERLADQALGAAA